jgi:hypothetical protein
MNPIGAQNAIVGDEFGIDLPETEQLEDQRAEEKSMARFSKTKEFKALKSKIDERIEFYQKVLPDGRPLTAVEAAERAEQWVIANVVIGEFKAILQAYTQAKEAVEDATRG